MRRNDFDVADQIRTTDPEAVRGAVAELYTSLYPNQDTDRLSRMFSDVVRLYDGQSPDYLPCDTGYHDLQHVLDVTLAMARLMHGFARSQTNGGPRLEALAYEAGLAAALLHDVGYLRRRTDRRHRYGSEYTLTHVSRSGRFIRKYLPTIGLEAYAEPASRIVHFTGYERPASTIRIADPLMRKIGYILGTADIVAQMSDRCYLEKCRDRLYPEFVLGGIAVRKGADGSEQVIFASGEDLVRKTPGFYANAMKRLDYDLEAVYDYALRHFEGRNLYVEEMRKNVHYAGVLAHAPSADLLRRKAPYTLLPDVEPYPKDLFIR